MNSLILLLLSIGSSPSGEQAQPDCRYWREQIVTPSQRSVEFSSLNQSWRDSHPSAKNDPWGVSVMDSNEKLRVIGCLMKSKGDRRYGVISGVTSNAISQTFTRSRAELVALFMVSYVYEGRVDHASAVALAGRDAGCETTKGYDARHDAIVRAYAAYSTWFETVQRIGLEEAKSRNLDPLEGSGLHWFELSEPRQSQKP